MEYFISDLHLNHNKPFVYEARGFNTIEEMNQAIIKNWNEKVSADDTVWVLGDCMLGNTDAGIEIMKQLNGHKHLIIGNHDTDARLKAYTDARIFESMQYATVLKFGKKAFYLSHYPTLVGNNDSKSYLVNLCGHSHVADPFKDWELGHCYHCECDAHNCTPISIDQIIEDIRQYKAKVDK